MPASRAMAIAVSAARDITRGPKPLSPSMSAVAAAVRSTVMLGRRLSPPAFTRLTYCGSRNTPWASAPVRSASVINSATRAAASGGISTATRASRMKARMAGADTYSGAGVGAVRAALGSRLMRLDYRIPPGSASRVTEESLHQLDERAAGAAYADARAVVVEGGVAVEGDGQGDQLRADGAAGGRAAVERNALVRKINGASDFLSRAAGKAVATVGILRRVAVLEDCQTRQRAGRRGGEVHVGAAADRGRCIVASAACQDDRDAAAADRGIAGDREVAAVDDVGAGRQRHAAAAGDGQAIAKHHDPGAARGKAVRSVAGQRIIGLIATRVARDGHIGVGVVRRRGAREGAGGGVERRLARGGVVARNESGIGVDGGLAVEGKRAVAGRVHIEIAAVEVERGVSIIGNVGDITAVERENAGVAAGIERRDCARIERRRPAEKHARELQRLRSRNDYLDRVRVGRMAR